MRQFSDAHIAALAVLAVAAVPTVWAARRYPGRWMVTWARALALVIIVGWVGEYVAEAVQGTWTVASSLPLQLTNAVSAVAVLALWTSRPMLVELLYFWSLTASLQATLTPDLAHSFPSALYFTYFAYHVAPVVAGCFLVLGCRLYPRPGAYWSVFVVTVAFAAVAGVGNLITGGNYMYLRAKPVHGSLLDVMGPWPLYILSTAVLGLAMLFALQLLADWLRQRDPISGARLPPHVLARQTYPR